MREMDRQMGAFTCFRCRVNKVTAKGRRLCEVCLDTKSAQMLIIQDMQTFKEILPRLNELRKIKAEGLDLKSKESVSDMDSLTDLIEDVRSSIRAAKKVKVIR